jgi:DNA-binding Xre family transcriptional regulator
MAKLHPLDHYMLVHNLNLDELAERTGIQRSIIYRVSRGQGCTLRTALRIAQATNITLNALANSLEPERVGRPDRRRVGQRRYEQRP